MYTPNYTLATHAPAYDPAVSIIMPFDPVMSQKSRLENRLLHAKITVEKAMLESYPAEVASEVNRRLNRLITGLNYYTNKKSIAMFVSPSSEKVFYLDMPVEEKIVDDQSFKMHDLVKEKKESKKYLLLVLTEAASKIYTGDGNHLPKLVANMPYRINGEQYTICHKNTRKEQMHSLVRYTDQGLTLLQQSYPYPVFVAGDQKVVKKFKDCTHTAIVQYLENYHNDADNRKALAEAMMPYINNWHPVKQAHLLHKVQQAEQDKKLVYGLSSVRHCAAHRNSRLLLIEKEFINRVDHPAAGINRTAQPFYIRDVVDDIVEKVLESNADVEFVDNGLLEQYQGIVLIRDH